MGIFDRLGTQPAGIYHEDPRGMREKMRREIGQISAHPSDYLKERGYSIPEEMTDAKQITQYLLQTGQVGTPRLRQVVSMFRR